jgi:hypothetical protein
MTSLEYRHLALYDRENITLTLVRSYCGGEVIEYVHNQKYDVVSFHHGFEDLHTEPYSAKEPINRYYLELYPLSIIGELTILELDEKFKGTSEDFFTARDLLQGLISIDNLSYRVYKMLIINRIDLFGFIQQDIALDINKCRLEKITIVKQ